MATHTLLPAHIVGSSLNATCPLFAGGDGQDYIKEVASSAWVAGDFLHIDANGLLAVCTDSTGIMSSAVDALAMTAATGTTGARHYCRVIRPDDIFVMNVYHGTPSSAVTAQAQLGVRYGLFKSAAGKWHVDVENTTNEDGDEAEVRVRVVGFPESDPRTGATATIGDTYGPVLCKVVPFSLASDATPIVHNMRLA